MPELSFNIIGGAPGCGKTTFAQQLMFGLAGPECKALFFTAMGEPPTKMLRGVLVDAIILQRFIESQCRLHTLVSVAKLRGSRHSRDFRTFEITDDGIVIGTGPAPFDSILHGTARMRESADW